MSLIIEMTEERINEVEDRSIKFTLSVCCPDNRRKLVGKITMNRASETFGTITLALTFVSLESQTEKRRL